MEDGEAWVSNFTSLSASPAEGGNENISSVVEDNPLQGNVTEYQPYHLRPETYLVPLVFSGIFVTGVVGNGALIFMFLKHPTLR